MFCSSSMITRTISKTSQRHYDMLCEQTESGKKHPPFARHVTSSPRRMSLARNSE